VTVHTLAAQLVGHAKRDRLPGARMLDFGDGLVTASND
jgi:hypothetical protein